MVVFILCDCVQLKIRSSVIDTEENGYWGITVLATVVKSQVIR